MLNLKEYLEQEHLREIAEDLNRRMSAIEYENYELKKRIGKEQNKSIFDTVTGIIPWSVILLLFIFKW
jgi:cell division protein ZapA (FtsZ GTPase activity inhibitor)